MSKPFPCSISVPSQLEGNKLSPFWLIFIIPAQENYCLNQGSQGDPCSLRASKIHELPGLDAGFYVSLSISLYTLRSFSLENYAFVQMLKFTLRYLVFLYSCPALIVTFELSCRSFNKRAQSIPNWCESLTQYESWGLLSSRTEAQI